MDKAWVKKQLIDQTAHFSAAVLLLALLVGHPVWWTAMIAGAGYGVVREITESAGNPITWEGIKKSFDKNSLLDITFWGLGGLGAWLLFA